MADQLKVDVKVDVGKAVKGLQQLGKQAKDAGESVEDLELNAKNVAKVMSAQVDNMIADMKAGERAADALAAALGPEMTAQIGTDKIDQLVADVHRAGIAFDDLTAEADQFADVLRKTASAGDGLKDVERAVQRVGAETDNTRSVVANFAGNAAQELPGVAAAMGPMNMAIGQFAEYAAEGNISLKNFIGASGGLVAAGLIMKNISDRMAAVAKIDAFKEKSVEGYTDALKDARGEVEAIQKALEAAGKVEFIFGDGDPSAWTGGISVIGDATKALQLLGLNAQQTAQLINGGEDAIGAWGASLIEAGASQAMVEAGMDALRQQAEFFGQAVENAAFNTSFFNEEVKGAGDYAEYYRSRADAATEQGELFAGSADRQRDAFHAATEKVRDMRDAVEELYGIERDAIQRQDDLADSLTDLNTVLGDSKASTEAQYDAAIAASEAYATLNGATLNSKEGTERQIESLQGLAASLDPKSPLRAALEKYIAQLAAIPARVDTMLALNISQGATTTKSGDTIGVRSVNGKVVNHASGTSSAPGGLTLVGEQGPELVMMPRGAEVLSAGRTSAALAGGGGGGNVYNVTISGSGMTAEQIVAAIKAWERRNGTSWRN